MILYDTLQPEDQVYDLVIELELLSSIYVLYADCKNRKHVNDHGPKYHYRRKIAESDTDDEEDYLGELQLLKSILEKYYKA